MNLAAIDSFYKQYVDEDITFQKDFLGHFNLLKWETLQKDQSGCERLQRKPFYKIALLSGQGVYSVDNNHIPVSGNSIIFTPPMARTGFKTDDENLSGLFCVFSESFLKGASRSALTELPIFRKRDVYTQSLTNAGYDELHHIFEQLSIEFLSDYSFKEHVLRNRLSDIIHYIQKSDKHLHVTAAEQDLGIEDRFFTILEHAFYNLNTHHTLVEKSPAYFANLLGTSVDQLNRSIKKATGKTTISIIHERLVEEANVLLKSTAYSVKEIAWCLHFQETSHFQNFYKKHTGITPVEYRTA